MFQIEVSFRVTKVSKSVIIFSFSESQRQQKIILLVVILTIMIIESTETSWNSICGSDCINYSRFS